MKDRIKQILKDYGISEEFGLRQKLANAIYDSVHLFDRIDYENMKTTLKNEVFRLTAENAELRKENETLRDRLMDKEPEQ